MTTSYKLTFSQKQFYHFAQLLTFGNEARKQAMANKWIAYMFVLEPEWLDNLHQLGVIIFRGAELCPALKDHMLPRVSITNELLKLKILLEDKNIIPPQLELLNEQIELIITFEQFEMIADFIIFSMTCINNHPFSYFLMSGIFHKEYIISDHIVAIAHWFSIYTGGALRKLSSVLEEITHE